MLNALFLFKGQLKAERGIAVENVKSYKKNIISNESRYECPAGDLITDVAKLDDVVKIAE